MKTISFFSLCLAALTVCGSETFCDFEQYPESTRWPKFWGLWSDAKSRRPEWAWDSSPAQGDRAIKITFPACTAFQGASYCDGKGVEDLTRSLSFFIKRISGSPPAVIEISEHDPAGKGRECFQAHFQYAPVGCWTRITIPLSKFRYIRQYGTVSGANQKLDPRKKISIALVRFGKHREESSIAIDALSWTKDDTPENPPVPQSTFFSPNRLDGDPDFETGVKEWIPWNLAEPEPLWIQGEGALGSHHSMQVRGVCVNKYKCGIVQAGKAYVLSFYAKGEKGDSLNVTMLSPAGAWHRLCSRTFRLVPEWRRYSIAIPEQKSVAPFYSILLTAPHPSRKVLIDAIQLEEGKRVGPFSPPALCQLSASTEEPGEIVKSGTIPTMKIRFHTSDPKQLKMPLVFDFSCGDFRKSWKAESVSSAKWEISCDFAAVPGYYPGEIRVSDADGHLLIAQKAPFVVAPSFQSRGDFFGIQTSMGTVPAEALKRIGVARIRFNMDTWAALEPDGPRKLRQGNVLAEKYNRMGFELLGTLLSTFRPPSWALRKGSRLPSAEAIGNYIRSQAASKAEDLCLELDNEVDWNYRKHAGATMRQAIDIYAELLNAAYPIVQKQGHCFAFNSTGSKEFSTGIFEKAGKSFDLYAVHPYCSPRVLAEDGRDCSTPENGGFLNVMKETEALIKKYGNRHSMAIGELGWSLGDSLDYDSLYAHRHAAYLARLFILSRTFPAKWLIWYVLMNAPESGRFDYGIWRNQSGPRPLPAVAAFAQAAYEFQSIRGLAETILDGDIRLIQWKTPDSAHFALWNTDAEAKPVEFHIPEAERIVSVYGTPLKGKVFSLTENPVYLSCRISQADSLKKQILQSIRNRIPLSLIPGLVRSDRLRLLVRNNQIAPWEGRIRTGGGEKTLRLVPKETKTVLLDLKTDFPLDRQNSLRVDLIRPGTAPIQTSITLPPLIPIGKRQFKDWKTFEFQKEEKVILLSQREHVLPPDPSVPWDGPEDLSAKLFFAWDHEYFYLFAEVVDDVHSNTFQGGDIWQGDVIQFSFDTRNDALPAAGYDHNDYEFGLALNKKPYCWYSPSGKKGMDETLRTKMNRSGNLTTYRAAIPWKSLGMSPAAGDVFGFALGIHDRDGNQSGYYLAFGRGVVGHKNPSLGKKLILKE